MLTFETRPHPHTMEFLVRFCQLHETFRVPELQALSVIEDVPISIVSYDPEVPFCIIRAPDAAAAARLIRRAILTQAVYEYWGSGATLDELHASIKQRSAHLWAQHSQDSWKFQIDSFQGTRSARQQRDIIETFAYLPLQGPIQMRDPDQAYVVLEQWPFDPAAARTASLSQDERRRHRQPTRYHFGRYLGAGARDLVKQYDLKKRPYISTTSMDAELALVTANIVLARPGALFYDPFVGTGSFPIACSAFGAVSFGSDIDGRAVRGSGNDARAEAKRGLVGGEKTLRGNFKFYDILGRLGDVFASDLTNSPLRRVPFGQAGAGGGRRRLFDGIVCDPPYGVREGLRVLGVRDPEGSPGLVEAGVRKHKFVAPPPPPRFRPPTIAPLNLVAG